MDCGAWGEGVNVLVLCGSEGGESYVVFGLPFGKSEGSVARVTEEETPVLGLVGEVREKGVGEVGGVG